MPKPKKGAEAPAAPAPEPKRPTVEELKQRLVEDEIARERICSEEVDAVLKKHRCLMVPRPFYRPGAGGGFVTEISVEVRAMPAQ